MLLVLIVYYDIQHETFKEVVCYIMLLYPINEKVGASFTNDFFWFMLYTVCSIGDICRNFYFILQKKKILSKLKIDLFKIY